MLVGNLMPLNTNSVFSAGSVRIGRFAGLIVTEFPCAEQSPVLDIVRMITIVEKRRILDVRVFDRDTQNKFSTPII